MTQEEDVLRVTADITVVESDSLILHVTSADNQLVVLVNDLIVLNERTERDPPLNITLEVGELLKTGRNYLNILGVNWGGPSHYAFRLDKNGNTIPSISRDDRPAGGGMNGIYQYSIELL